MFIFNLTYRKPIAEVDRVLPAHRAFLDQQYQQKKFICSGPKTPRVGGIILCSCATREEAEAVMKQDPFYTENIADYEVIEFSPVKSLDGFAQLLENK